MAREYCCTMPANALVTTALPFFQLNVAAGVPVNIVGIEITNETSTTSAILVAVCQRRSTASTTFANTVQAPTVLNPKDGAAATTYSWGITTAAGTAVDTPTGPRWGFNALSGLFWVPTPSQEITLITTAASWWTINLAAAPSPALTLSANIYIRE